MSSSSSKREQTGEVPGIATEAKSHTARSVSCPACGSTLLAGDEDVTATAVEIPHQCPRCKRRFVVRMREQPRPANSVTGTANSQWEMQVQAPADTQTLARQPQTVPISTGLDLTLRSACLFCLQAVYPLVTALGFLLLCLCGGIFLILRRWLRDELELNDFRALVETLGGVWLEGNVRNPETDLGPLVTLGNGAELQAEVMEIARRTGSKPPREIRLTYLPCCGVVASSGRDRALLVGLPLLSVLNRGELRAVLAHELSHWARRDASSAERANRFVDGLAQGLAHTRGAGLSWLSPLRWWASFNQAVSMRLSAPLILGQELRADRTAAWVAGGDRAASALMKLAIVQPMFREVLDHLAQRSNTHTNLYAFFRAFWQGLPEASIVRLRHGLLSGAHHNGSELGHPDLLDRLALSQTFPPRKHAGSDEPATSVLGDLDACEEMLHDRLFGLGGVEPSVFHRAGSA